MYKIEVYDFKVSQHGRCSVQLRCVEADEGFDKDVLGETGVYSISIRNKYSWEDVLTATKKQLERASARIEARRQLVRSVPAGWIEEYPDEDEQVEDVKIPAPPAWVAEAGKEAIWAWHSSEDWRNDAETEEKCSTAYRDVLIDDARKAYYG